MIGKISGTIVYAAANTLIVDTGGVGYLVHTTPHNAHGMRTGEAAEFWTYLAVRDTALDLYGFKEKEELEFFEILISISGIGPKKALQILTATDTATLRRAAQTGDPSYLQKISGIGKKNAEKLVVELQDKFGALADAEGAGADGDVFDALKGFGYGASEIHEVVRALPSEMSDPGERIKEALKRLGR